ncbi:hypothetical protein L0128_10780 [candidate division KSB1 bacterium]|nr:hypothetical protein [candidate division KSB1 bacterium]
MWRQLHLGLMLSLTIGGLVNSNWAQESRPTEFNLPVAAPPRKISVTEAARRLQDAGILFAAGKTEAAIYALQQLEKDDPANYEVLFKLAEMAVADRNWAYAIEVLRKASVVRRRDIPVRLILMDIFRAYQMPIQEIMVGREILALDPAHVDITQRLAQSYQNQGLPEEELVIRQELMRLAPENYTNLKRLADIFEDQGEDWEAALVYEQIRRNFPDCLADCRRLAALYHRMQESFRELMVLDHIAAQGESRGWMQGSAMKNLRQQLGIFDPFQSEFTFRKEHSEELDVYSLTSEGQYQRIRLRSNWDLGIFTNYNLYSHSGRDSLAGTMNINSQTLGMQVTRNWRATDFRLVAFLGVRGEHISGNLHPRTWLTQIDQNDYPFLADTTYRFDKFGGLMPVGTLRLVAKPGLRTQYQLVYEHEQIHDLEGRLRLFYFDRVGLGWDFETEAHTALNFFIETAWVSDKNLRLHGQTGFSYLLWGSQSKSDYRQRRLDFLKQPPFTFLSLSYFLDYYHDQKPVRYYETYRQEVQHEGQIIGQTRLFRIGPEQHLFLKMQLAYARGKTMRLQERAGLGLAYRDYEYQNELALWYQYDYEKVKPSTQWNQLFAGKFLSQTIALQLQWYF